jgi:hypothetical protein
MTLPIDGYIPQAIASIYQVPASKVAIVRSITINNVNAATQTIIIAINRGLSRQMLRFELQQNEFAIAELNWLLVAGDKIEASATTASANHYLVIGAER